MKQHLPLLFLLLALLLASCAPSQAMVATLTLLPGTPTPKPPTPWPTRTPQATNTLAPVRTRLATETPIPPAECPTGDIDTAPPEDPSQLPGRHYDLKNLPEEFTMQASGALSESDHEWVQVKWQGRSLFWTQKPVCKDTRGKVLWEVVDVLALPRLDARLGEAMTTQCFLGERAAPFVVAYGIFDPSQPASPLEGGVTGWPLQAQAAWEITETFTPISASGLRCVVPEKK